MKWLNTVSAACLAGLIATAAGAEVAATYRQFRVIEEGGKVTKTEPILSIQTPLWAKDVSQTPYAWAKPETAAKPYFKRPLTFVRPPAEGSGEPFGSHNHCPAITWCDNGDLLAIWYSTEREQSPDLTMLAARLRAGASEWDPAAEFFKSARRNMHGDSLFRDQSGKLFHFNGMGMEGASRWNKLALLLRTSTDQGVTWSAARPISSGATYQLRHMPIAGGFETKNGWLIQLCDGTEGGEGPSAMHISRDGGLTWNDAGGDIRGIHASVVGLTDGRLMAFGRGQAIDGKMPVSISRDMGKTWTYKASPFPPIGGGQRLTLIRLREGPIMLVSFTSGNRKNPAGMDFTDEKGNTFSGTGMFAALSFDQGETWPVRKLLTPGEGEWDGGAWTGNFTASPTRAEHAGYLAATQTPDNMIHLISSRLHYQFNLAWLKTPPPAIVDMPDSDVQRTAELRARAAPVTATTDVLHAADAPLRDPASPVMVSGAWLPENPHQLDFASLPKVPTEHAVVSDVRAKETVPNALNKTTGGVNQHNYLTHHDGQFWAMWSDGPGIEDRVGQRVKFATSPNGLKWSTPKFMTPVPQNSGPDSPHYGTRTAKGMRWISRGFWNRDGELLALASLDEAAGFFGRSLELRAFRFDKGSGEWRDAGAVFKNTINNFPPNKLRTGNWMMSRRMHDYSKTGVHFLVGGVKALDDWRSFPVLGSASELKAEEPDWWILPDNRLAAVFRDNRRSGYLYRSISADDGRTWSKPIKTNFPDATSKISGLRLSDGRYVLVSNPNPKKRDPLTLSISDDGLVFTKMLYLVGGRWIDYPHVMEHEGSLLIAFAGGKQTVEVLKVKLSDVDAVKMPEIPLSASPKP